jgi:hypothetical protein
LRKEHRLRIFENGVLRKIFGLIREDVTVKWREFMTRRFRICTIYYWDKQIIQKEMGGACGTYGEDKKYVQVFGGATRGKKTSWKT